jgi:hypothetical protein
MKERLAKFIKNEELLPKRFAEIMEIPASSVSHLLNGRNKPGYEFISKMLIRFPNVNPDWLILGTGSMYRTETAKPTLFPPESISIPQEPYPGDVHCSSAEDIPAKPSGNSEIIEVSRPNTSDNPAHSNSADSEIERIVFIRNDGTFRSFLPSV